MENAANASEKKMVWNSYVQIRIVVSGALCACSLFMLKLVTWFA